MLLSLKESRILTKQLGLSINKIRPCDLRQTTAGMRFEDLLETEAGHLPEARVSASPDSGVSTGTHHERVDLFRKLEG